jgi:hypothetical protein
MSLASESMKALTQRVIKADLASRNKRRIYSTTASVTRMGVTAFFVLWAVWVNYL